MADVSRRRTRVPWERGRWTTPPTSARREGDVLVVEAAPGSDFWRSTAYGFVHDDGHALLAPLAAGSAVEVSFVADLTEQFDQAGVLLRADAETWIKAGVEVSDGILGVGAVVTRGRSDWSVAPVPSWTGRVVTMRASWSGDAVIVRARVAGEPWQLVRVAPWDPTAATSAGPYVCAPTRSGLRVHVLSWTVGSADTALHEPTS